MSSLLTTPIKVGIFLGGHSREREISFSSGRTVYDQLDRKLFDPVPIFVDSLGNFILLHWQYLYRGSIREFYPPVAPSNHLFNIPLYIESLTTSNSSDIDAFIERIGRKIAATDFSKYFDFAFLCLNGPYGEDGSIQGLLEWHKMPYSGSGILPAALGINKVFQKKIMQNEGFLVPDSIVLSQDKWLNTKDKNQLLEQSIALLGFPFVVKSSKQGSSIGVTIVQNSSLISFITAVNSAFFIEEVNYSTWKNYTIADQKEWLNKLIDIRTGIGFPLLVANQVVHTSSLLLEHITLHFQREQTPILLISTEAEEEIIIETFIEGREFSSIVLEEKKGKAIALPPTELLKGKVHFDYRAKYLPGIVRKQTPMLLPTPIFNAIGKEVVRLFHLLNCQVYARIDGFLTNNNQIFLNDPNTTAGMNPSSFLFHQAATIGLNPTQLLTFLIKRSLETRKYSGSLIASTLLKRMEEMLLYS